MLSYNPQHNKVTMNSLFSHQQRLVSHMMKHRGCIAVHKTGSGKTRAAIATVFSLQSASMIQHTYVITPLTCIKQFEEECASWTLPHRDQISFLTSQAFMSFREANPKHNFSRDFFIVDESHNMRTNVRVSSRDEIQSGALAYHLADACSQACKVLLLTATPVVNHQYDIYNQLMMVSGVSSQQYIEKAVFDKNINTHMDDFLRLCKCKFSFHGFETDDVLASMRMEVPVENTTFTMSPSFYQQYKTFETRHLTVESQSTINSKAKVNNFMSAMRQGLNMIDGEDNPKIVWLRCLFQQIKDTNQKVVIYSNWKKAGLDIIKKACEASEIAYACVSGDQTDEQRFQSRELYNSDSVQALLITKAGGEGLDLKGTRHMVLFESNWNVSTEEQIIGRAIRTGSHDHLEPSERNVHVYRLRIAKPKSMVTVDTPLSEDIKLAEDQYLKEIGERDSSDMELYRIAHHAKEAKLASFFHALRKTSIEANECSCESKKASIMDIMSSSNNPFIVEQHKTKQAKRVRKDNIVNKDKQILKAVAEHNLSISSSSSQWGGHASYVEMMACKKKKCVCQILH